MSGIPWDQLRVAFERRVPRDVRHLARDIAAESITRLFLAMNAGRKIENPLAYGNVILQNVVHETRRKDRLVELDVDCLPSPDVEVPSSPAPDLEILKKRLFSAGERKMFDLYYREGGNVKRRREKLAQRLEMPIGTLYTRICRLKDRLRAEVAESNELDG